MRRCAVVAVVAACSPAPSRPIPGASLTPHLDDHSKSTACGDVVRFGGDTATDLYYVYDYDELGRLSHVTGSYTLGGNISVDYSYDNVGHMTHSLQTSSDATTTIVAHFDTLGDLVDYTWDDVEPSYHDSVRYTYLALGDTGQPTRETVSQLGQPDLVYTLAYDAKDRLALTAQDGGPPTIYTYDDDARTETIDTNSGQFHGEIMFDDFAHELSETWGGTDPAALATATTYAWDGDRLISVTYQSADAQAPTVLSTIETDTLLYDCAR